MTAGPAPAPYDAPAVQVVAHRGASADLAEHTSAAYTRAIEEGADALECDVRRTRDGVLVCVHDRRVDRTSDGRGVVSTMGIEELELLDFGRAPLRREGAAPGAVAAGLHRDPLLTAAWEGLEETARSVLTLERLLETVADAGRRVELAIETKHPTRYAGLVEQDLVHLLGRFGLLRPDGDGRYAVRVMSFAPTSLRRVHTLAPGLPTVLLMRRVPVRLRDGSLPPRIPIAGPSIELVREHPGYVQRVRERGGEVHVWTVNDPADVDLVVALGATAVITDAPRRVLRQLGRLPG